MLNPASPLPLYRQLADNLLTAIRSGQLATGARIPGEHALAARYGVGRPTVRQATELLVRRGVLRRKRGAGTFVQQAPQDVDIFSLAGTLSAFEGRGAAVEHTLLQAPRLGAGAAESPLAGRAVWHLSRLTSMDARPVLREDFALDADAFPDLDRHDMRGRSLSELVLENYHLQPTGGRQVFAVCSTPVSALSDDGTPTLLIERTLDFVAAPAAVYVQMYCRTDRCSFSHMFSHTPDPLTTDPLPDERNNP